MSRPLVGQPSGVSTDMTHEEGDGAGEHRRPMAAPTGVPESGGHGVMGISIASRAGFDSWQEKRCREEGGRHQ